jgi:DNA repair protein RecO (recombination protein O)
MPRSARGGGPLAAFVLHRWDWSETSLILDLFTREQGRVAVAAKGAKRPYSQLRPVLLPFQRLQVSLGRPIGDEAAEVQTLRAAEWAGGAPMLTGDALFSGFYLNELLMKLLARSDPNPALFDAYSQTLPSLAQGDDGAQAAMRAFEIVLLRETGLLPELGVLTATQEPVSAERSYSLRGEAGVVPERSDDAGIGGDVLIALQTALDAGRFDALAASCGRSLVPLRSVLRALLYYHLGSAQPLRSRQALVDVHRLLDEPARRS